MVDLAPRVGYQADSAAASSTRRYYVLALLTIIYALNFLDRTIFNVLIEPIKKEFTLSDTAMGLLAGFGFVLFYSLLGIPIARVADRLNRRNIVALAFAFWSAMTFLCGMASSVATLTLARIGVGIGESAGTPASQSLLADLFGKNERPARARHLCRRHVSRRVPRLFHRRLCQSALRLAHGVLLRRPAWHRARSRRVVDRRRTQTRRDGGNLYARADRPDARLSRLAKKLCHRADRLLPDHLYQLRHRGLDSRRSSPACII